MITNFESITEPLSTEDLWLSTSIMNGLKLRSKDNPIKGADIVKSINEKYHLDSKFTEVRLRKIVNYIRSNGLLGVVATSNGYHSTNDVKEIEKQVISLRERASSIMNSVFGLEKLKNKLIS